MNNWTPEISLRKEPYRVLLKRGEFTDLKRDRRIVPYKIYYPVDHNEDKIPIILWSHGFGGNRDGASFLSRFFAEQGYIIVHITHAGTDSSLWEGKDGHAWDILQKATISRDDTLNRIYDVPFVLDQLETFAQENPDIGKHMDLNRICMSGHSFGAMTTQVMAGMKFPDHKNHLISLREPRISCGILYSPVPIDHLNNAPPKELYSSIDIPLLHMTGTNDTSPLGGYDYKHRLTIYKHSNHPEKYLQILDNGDHMVYNGTRGKLAHNPQRTEHERKIQIAAFAFLESYLKSNKAAKDWLKAKYKDA